jgi:hypothetical protein
MRRGQRLSRLSTAPLVQPGKIDVNRFFPSIARESGLPGMAKQPPVVNFSQSSDELERRDQPVTEADLLILKRADEILSSPPVWNRHDTRVCKPEDKTWSLFCAIEKAPLDVLGEYHHREVALQEVRFAVEDVTKGIEFEHRMDYNNLPSTQFSDIKHIIKTATDRVNARLVAQKKKQEQSKIEAAVRTRLQRAGFQEKGGSAARI